MLRKAFLLVPFVLLLLGGGCSTSTENSVSQQTPRDVDIQNNKTESFENNQGQQIVLTATVVGNHTVDFNWTVDEASAQSSEGWRILYGTEANPTYPSTWWFERSKPHRQKLWSGLPAGHAYFRLCLVVGDACMLYSNNVEVDIPGEGLATSTVEQADQTGENIDAEVQEEIAQ